jgi:hypothetical protein
VVSLISGRFPGRLPARPCRRRPAAPPPSAARARQIKRLVQARSVRQATPPTPCRNILRSIGGAPCESSISLCSYRKMGDRTAASIKRGSARAHHLAGAAPLAQEVSMVARPPGFDAALSFYAAGRIGDVERICEQVLASNPVDPDALHLFGLVHASRQKYEGAGEFNPARGRNQAPARRFLRESRQPVLRQGPSERDDSYATSAPFCSPISTTCRRLSRRLPCMRAATRRERHSGMIRRPTSRNARRTSFSTAGCSSGMTGGVFVDSAHTTVSPAAIRTFSRPCAIGAASASSPIPTFTRSRSRTAPASCAIAVFRTAAASCRFSKSPATPKCCPASSTNTTAAPPCVCRRNCASSAAHPR